MKIFLLGKNGQLGGELERQTKQIGCDIVSFGREELDVSDCEKVNQWIKKYKPDIVINASAYHVVQECEKYPEKAFLINASAIKNLAEVCELVGSKLVHYSTDYVFDGLKGSPYVEDDEPSPLQTYGISKLAGEYYALRYSRKSMVIRTCGVYGGKSGSRSKGGNFILSILKQMEGKKELEVSSEQIVNPTYAVDLAMKTLELIKKEDATGIYHLGSSGYCSWAEFSQKIAHHKGLGVKIIPVNRRGGDGSLMRPLFSALRNVRANKYGISMPHWNDALRRYLKVI